VLVAVVGIAAYALGTTRDDPTPIERVVIAGTTNDDATRDKWVTAECPDGMTAMSGGAVVPHGNDTPGVAIYWSAPYEDHGTSGWWAAAQDTRDACVAAAGPGDLRKGRRHARGPARIATRRGIRSCGLNTRRRAEPPATRRARLKRPGEASVMIGGRARIARRAAPSHFVRVGATAWRAPLARAGRGRSR
jgi:hypothetical protein